MGTLLPRPRVLPTATPPHLCCLTAVPTLRDPPPTLAHFTRKSPSSTVKESLALQPRTPCARLCVRACVCVCRHGGAVNIVAARFDFSGHRLGPPGRTGEVTPWADAGCRISAEDTRRNRRWGLTYGTVRIVACPACRCRPNFFCACLRDLNARAPRLEMHLVRGFLQCLHAGDGRAVHLVNNSGARGIRRGRSRSARTTKLRLSPSPREARTVVLSMSPQQLCS